MTSLGVVHEWYDDEGWGFIQSERFEVAEQDGYSFRAVEIWPSDASPVRRGDVSETSAMRSELRLTFDQGPSGPV